ncbi:hypothetical protein SRHO_G00020560 [Serrasalmus rhombeus]
MSDIRITMLALFFFAVLSKFGDVFSYEVTPLSAEVHVLEGRHDTATLSCNYSGTNILAYQCLRSSWFSKLFESILALLVLKISPAVLKRRSQAAEAGKAVLTFKDNLTAGKDFRISLSSTLQAR